MGITTGANYCFIIIYFLLLFHKHKMGYIYAFLCYFTPHGIGHPSVIFLNSIFVTDFCNGFLVHIYILILCIFCSAIFSINSLCVIYLPDVILHFCLSYSIYITMCCSYMSLSNLLYICLWCRLDSSHFIMNPSFICLVSLVTFVWVLILYPGHLNSVVMDIFLLP